MKTTTVLIAMAVILAGTVATMQPASADHVCSAEMAALVIDQEDLDHCVQDALNDAQDLVDNVGSPLGDALRVRIQGPDRVWISDRYEISVMVANQDLSLHLVSVDVLPRAQDICSVVSYSTSSSGTQTRPNEYLLQGNGTASLLGLSGGDHIAVGAAVKPNAPGRCEILIRITMDALFQEEAVLTTTIDVPPPFADLGDYVADVSSCSGSAVSKAATPTSLTVAADTPIDIIASLQYAESCNDDNAIATLNLLKQEADGSWTTVGTTQLTNTGTSDARVTEKPTLHVGTYTYRVDIGAADGFSISWGCLGAILGDLAAIATILALHGGSVAAAAAWLGATIVTGGWAAVALLAAIIAGVIALGLGCFGDAEIFQSDPFTITAIQNEPCAAKLMMLNVEHLLDDLTDCAISTSQQPGNQVAQTLEDLDL